jgi:hypothetical protein
MEKTVQKIIKVGKLEFMESFLQKGEMYFDTVESFAIKDANQEKYDNLEGATEINQVNWIKLQAENGKTIELSKINPKHVKLASAYLITHDEKTIGNIYSCSAVTPETINNFKKLDPRFKNFGDTIILIENPNEFLNRVKEELKGKNYKYTIGLVNYYDPDTFNGPLTVFSKKNKLAYQNELRILIYNKNNEPIKIYIGSIKDIACKFKIEDLMKSIKYEA